MTSCVSMPQHKNPVLTGFNPDPSIVRVGHDFFMVTSTFEYFPGLPIYHSTDLVSWELIGHALTRRSQLDIRTVEPGSGVWAPTIRYHGGRFYIITCSFASYCPQQNLRVWPRGFHVSTTNIWQDEQWSDPTYFDQPGFDQDIFWDGYERVYLSTCYRAVDHDPASHLKGFAVHVSEIDLESGRSISAPVIARKSASGVAEGPHIIKRGGYHYLLTAEGGTESGHSEHVFRNRTGPLGAWEQGPNNPILSATLRDDVQNTGHVDLAEDADGAWWAVCLAIRPPRIDAAGGSDGKFLPSPFGRETFLMRVRWVDDWPVFDEGRSLQLDFQSSQDAVTPDYNWREDFNSESLTLGWYNKNTPLKREWSLTERPEHLRLWGGPYNLQSLESPTLLLRKQTRSTGIWSTRLHFDPNRPTCEAGTVLYWNLYTFASIGVRASLGGGREIWFTQPGDQGPGTFKHTFQPIPSNGPVDLAISCSKTHYKLGYTLDDSETQDWIWFENIPMEVMTADPPKGMAFTGMMLGLYAFGELEPCLRPADSCFAAWTDGGENAAVRD